MAKSFFLGLCEFPYTHLRNGRKARLICLFLAKNLKPTQKKQRQMSLATIWVRLATSTIKA